MKLSDTQLVILSQAAQRDDSAIVLPEKLKGGAAKKVVNRLLEQGLIAECAAGGGLPVWHQAEDGQRIALVVTAAGLAAIGISEEGEQGGANATTTGQPKTKQEIILQLLRRMEGASIAEMVAATGWQAHSLRGFLSGTIAKKLQMPVVSEKGENGVRRYHIAAVANAAA
jgi:hypothetical protein